MANKKNNGLVVRYIDIENSRMWVRFPTYSLYNNDRIHPKYIEHEWYVTCAAWADLDIKNKKIGRVHTVATNDFPARYKQDFRDDFKVVEKMHQVLSETDIVIGHNSDAFDLKKLNYKFTYHGLPAIDMPVKIDTLKAARKYYRSTSNSLFHLAKEFGVDMKDDLPKGVMHAADEGCEKSLKRLVKYNKQDIRAGASLYFKMLPYIKNHPDIRRMSGLVDTPTEGRKTPVCGTCGSKNVVKNGTRPSKLGKFQKLLCNNCGSSTQHLKEKKI